jgi:hypothetical protein
MRGKKSLSGDYLRVGKRYAGPIILGLLFSAVTVFAVSELFHHQLKGPSTTAALGPIFSSSCANGPITPSPSSFTTTTFSALFQCAGGTAPVTCLAAAGQATGTCSRTAIVSSTQGGAELTGPPSGYSAYDLYLVGHGSSIGVNCASITGVYILFLSASPPPSTGQPAAVVGTPSPGSSYDYCADGTLSQAQGSDVYVSWT